MTPSAHFPDRKLWVLFPFSLVNPRFLGGHTYGFDVYHHAQTHPWEVTAYIGTSALLLAVIALLRPRARWLRWGAFGSIAVLLFVWGSPLYDVVVAVVPPLRGITPGRFLVVPYLMLCLLAAWGADAVASEGASGTSVRWPLRIAWGAVLALALNAIVLALAGDALQCLPTGPRGVARWLRLTNGYMLATLVFLATGVASVHGLARGARWARPLLLAFLVAELFTFGLEFNPTSPPETIYPETKALAWLQRERGDARVWARRVRPEWGWPMPNCFMPYGIPVIEGFEAVMTAAYTRLANEAAGIPPESYQRKIWFDRPPLALLRLLGVKYVVADRDRPVEIPGAEKVYDGEVLVLRLANALPRAWVVHCVRGATEAETCRLLLSGGIDPLREAVIEELPPGHSLVIGGDGSPARVSAVRDEGDVLSLDVATDRPGLLVVADAMAKGWRCWVDGDELPVQRVDGLFRGVAIAREGTHRVEMRYRPVTFAVGFGVSLVSLLLVGLAVFVRPRHGAT